MWCAGSRPRSGRGRGVASWMGLRLIVVWGGACSALIRAINEKLCNTPPVVRIKSIRADTASTRMRRAGSTRRNGRGSARTAAGEVADGRHGDVYLSENSKPQRHSFFSLILGKSGWLSNYFAMHIIGGSDFAKHSLRSIIHYWESITVETLYTSTNSYVT